MKVKQGPDVNQHIFKSSPESITVKVSQSYFNVILYDMTYYIRKCFNIFMMHCALAVYIRSHKLLIPFIIY